MGVPLVTVVNVWDLFAEFVEQVEVAVETGVVAPQVFREWCNGVVKDWSGDNQVNVEAELHAQQAPGFGEQLDVDGPVPHGFAVFGGPALAAAEFTDDEDEGEVDEWLVN